MAKTQKNKATSFHLGKTLNIQMHVGMLTIGQGN
jgi:hypothetical protein